MRPDSPLRKSTAAAPLRDGVAEQVLGARGIDPPSVLVAALSASDDVTEPTKLHSNLLNGVAEPYPKARGRLSGILEIFEGALLVGMGIQSAYMLFFGHLAKQRSQEGGWFSVPSGPQTPPKECSLQLLFLA